MSNLHKTKSIASMQVCTYMSHVSTQRIEPQKRYAHVQDGHKFCSSQVHYQIDTTNCSESYGIAKGMEWYKTKPGLAYLADVLSRPRRPQC